MNSVGAATRTHLSEQASLKHKRTHARLVTAFIAASIVHTAPVKADDKTLLKRSNGIGALTTPQGKLNRCAEAPLVIASRSFLQSSDQRHDVLEARGVTSAQKAIELTDVQSFTRHGSGEGSSAELTNELTELTEPDSFSRILKPLKSDHDHGLDDAAASSSASIPDKSLSSPLLRTGQRERALAQVEARQALASAKKAFGHADKEADKMANRYHNALFKADHLDAKVNDDSHHLDHYAYMDLQEDYAWALLRQEAALRDLQDANMVRHQRLLDLEEAELKYKFKEDPNHPDAPVY